MSTLLPSLGAHGQALRQLRPSVRCFSDTLSDIISSLTRRQMEARLEADDDELDLQATVNFQATGRARCFG